MAATETPDHYRLATAEFRPNADPDAKVDCTAWITVDEVDDEGEIVIPSGCDLSRLNKAPLPLMICHDWQRNTSWYPLPVGSIPWVEIHPHGIKAGVKFSRTSPMGLIVKGLVDEEVLNGVSVGMLVVKQGPLTAAEAATRPDWQAGFERTRGKINVIRKWKLVEVSVAPVQANSSALFARMAAKGLSWPKAIAPGRRPALPILSGRTDEQHAAEQLKGVARQVRAILDTKSMGDSMNMNENEEVGPLRKGACVVVVKGPNRGSVGRVKSIHRNGIVPDVEDNVMGTEADPACRVQAFTAMGDGHRVTGHHFGVKLAQLRPREEFRPPSRRKGLDLLDLPPLTGMSDEQYAASQLKGLAAGLRESLVTASPGQNGRGGPRPRW